MFNYCFRIALNSEMHDERLQKMYGKKYVVNVEDLKSKLHGLSLLKDNFQYSLIIHDRDVTCNKSHLHLVVSFEDIYLLDFFKDNYFPVGYSKRCNSFDACLLYLLHRGHADKVQYDVDELFTNIDYYDRFPFLKKEVL